MASYKDIKMILDVMDSDAIEELQTLLYDRRGKLFYCAYGDICRSDCPCSECDYFQLG